MIGTDHTSEEFPVPSSCRVLDNAVSESFSVVQRCAVQWINGRVVDRFGIDPTTQVLVGWQHSLWTERIHHRSLVRFTGASDVLFSPRLRARSAKILPMILARAVTVVVGLIEDELILYLDNGTGIHQLVFIKVRIHVRWCGERRFRPVRLCRVESLSVLTVCRIGNMHGL